MGLIKDDPPGPAPSKPKKKAPSPGPPKKKAPSPGPPKNKAPSPAPPKKSKPKAPSKPSAPSAPTSQPSQPAAKAGGTGKKGKKSSKKKSSKPSTPNIPGTLGITPDVTVPPVQEAARTLADIVSPYLRPGGTTAPTVVPPTTIIPPTGYIPPNVAGPGYVPPTVVPPTGYIPPNVAGPTYVPPPVVPPTPTQDDRDRDRGGDEDEAPWYEVVMPSAGAIASGAVSGDAVPTPVRNMFGDLLGGTIGIAQNPGEAAAMFVKYGLPALTASTPLVGPVVKTGADIAGLPGMKTLLTNAVDAAKLAGTGLKNLGLSPEQRASLGLMLNPASTPLGVAGMVTNLTPEQQAVLTPENVEQAINAAAGALQLVNPSTIGKGAASLVDQFGPGIYESLPPNWQEGIDTAVQPVAQALQGNFEPLWDLANSPIGKTIINAALPPVGAAMQGYNLYNYLQDQANYQPVIDQVMNEPVAGQPGGGPEIPIILKEGSPYEEPYYAPESGEADGGRWVPDLLSDALGMVSWVDDLAQYTQDLQDYYDSLYGPQEVVYDPGYGYGGWGGGGWGGYGGAYYDPITGRWYYPDMARGI